jgi:hypothetical protein
LDVALQLVWRKSRKFIKPLKDSKIIGFEGRVRGFLASFGCTTFSSHSKQIPPYLAVCKGKGRREGGKREEIERKKDMNNEGQIENKGANENKRGTKEEQKKNKGGTKREQRENKPKWQCSCLCRFD